MPTLEWDELKAFPTLCTGQAADLKLDDGSARVWVSRCGLADGETMPVQAERLTDGRWENIEPEIGRSMTVHCFGYSVRLYKRMFSRV